MSPRTAKATMQTVIESVEPAQITVTTNICAGTGRLAGIFVSSATAAPTLTIYDDAGTGTTRKIVDTFTLTAGSYFKLPFRFYLGCYIVIAGAASVTVGFARA